MKNQTEGGIRFSLAAPITNQKIDLDAELQPENGLEATLLHIPEFVEGLLWGVPRYGHPEGEIYKHVREVLSNIDLLKINAGDRTRLRLIAYAHDTFKHLEDKSYPRDWSKHHGVYARRFLEKFTTDRTVLNIVELHDEAYYCWRMKHLYHQPRQGDIRLHTLLDRLQGDLQLYYLFFKCDTQTGDKNQAPLKWFEYAVDGIAPADL